MTFSQQRIQGTFLFPVTLKSINRIPISHFIYVIAQLCVAVHNILGVSVNVKTD